MARDAKAEMHRLRIFPVFTKKGQNYSSGSLVWFVVLSCHTSHRQEKERACVSWAGSCHPCLASKNHPLRVIDRVNSTRFTKLSFETSRSCATIPLLPPRARPLVGTSRPSAAAPLGLAGPSGAPRAPNSIRAEKQRRTKLSAVLKAPCGRSLRRAQSFIRRQVDAKYAAAICTHVASLRAAP